MDSTHDDTNPQSRQERLKDSVAAVLFGSAFAVNLGFVLGGIGQPLIDLHAFRQSQTALSTYWIAVSSGWQGWFNYETPVLGYPWHIPFEFPLYQWGVAGIYKLTGWPLDTVGRAVSALFFYACLVPLRTLARDCRLDRRLFHLVGAMFLLSPLYCYWSRGFLIESTSLFFALLYLALIRRHLLTFRRYPLVLATLAGVVAILVKVTTFPAFAVAAALFVVAHMWETGLWTSLVRAGRTYAPVLVSTLVIGVSLVVWVHHADAQKETSVFGGCITSAALHTWNYGTLSQRLGPDLWIRTLWDRMVPDILGSPLALGVMLTGLLYARRRTAGAILVLLGLFMLPIAVFTNLHIQHEYYQYANALFLTSAVAVALWEISKTASPLGFLAICAVMAASDMLTFYRAFHPFTSYYSHFDSRLQIAEYLEDNTPPGSVILVIGDGWKPVIAYYAERRAIYLDFATPQQLEGVLDHPTEFSGGARVAAVVDRVAWVPASLAPAWNACAQKLAAQANVTQFGDFRVFLMAPSATGSERARTPIPESPLNPAAAKAVRMAMDCLSELPPGWQGAPRQVTGVSGQFDLVKLNGVPANLALPALQLTRGAFLEFRGWQGQPTLDRADRKLRRAVLLCLRGRQTHAIRYAWAEMGGDSIVTRKDTEGKETKGNTFTNGLQSKVRVPDDLPADTYELSVLHRSEAGIHEVRQKLVIELVVP